LAKPVLLPLCCWAESLLASLPLLLQKQALSPAGRQEPSRIFALFWAVSGVNEVSASVVVPTAMGPAESSFPAAGGTGHGCYSCG